MSGLSCALTDGGRLVTFGMHISFSASWLHLGLHATRSRQAMAGYHEDMHGLLLLAL